LSHSLHFLRLDRTADKRDVALRLRSQLKDVRVCLRIGAVIRAETQNSLSRGLLKPSGTTVSILALTTSPGARIFYDQHRAADDTHHQALRALGNRLVGILHGCLRHHTPYDEHIAWAHRMPAAA
jgi:hypothetical protein